MWKIIFIQLAKIKRFECPVNISGQFYFLPANLHDPIAQLKSQNSRELWKVYVFIDAKCVNHEMEIAHLVHTFLPKLSPSHILLQPTLLDPTPAKTLCTPAGDMQGYWIKCTFNGTVKYPSFLNRHSNIFQSVDRNSKKQYFISILGIILSKDDKMFYTWFGILVTITLMPIFSVKSVTNATYKLI